MEFKINDSRTENLKAGQVTFNEELVQKIEQRIANKIRGAEERLNAKIKTLERELAALMKNRKKPGFEGDEVRFAGQDATNRLVELIKTRENAISEVGRIKEDRKEYDTSFLKLDIRDKVVFLEESSEAITKTPDAKDLPDWFVKYGGSELLEREIYGKGSRMQGKRLARLSEATERRDRIMTPEEHERMEETRKMGRAELGYTPGIFEKLPASDMLMPILGGIGVSLLLGPRGTGKTHILRAIAEEKSVVIYELDKDDLSRGIINKYRMATSDNPQFMILDDVHYLLKSMKKDVLDEVTFVNFIANQLEENIERCNRLISEYKGNEIAQIKELMDLNCALLERLSQEEVAGVDALEAVYAILDASRAVMDPIKESMYTTYSLMKEAEMITWQTEKLVKKMLEPPITEERVLDLIEEVVEEAKGLGIKCILVSDYGAAESVSRFTEWKNKKRFLEIINGCVENEADVNVFGAYLGKDKLKSSKFPQNVMNLDNRGLLQYYDNMVNRQSTTPDMAFRFIKDYMDDAMVLELEEMIKKTLEDTHGSIAAASMDVQEKIEKTRKEILLLSELYSKCLVADYKERKKLLKERIIESSFFNTFALRSGILRNEYGTYLSFATDKKVDEIVKIIGEDVKRHKTLYPNDNNFPLQSLYYSLLSARDKDHQRILLSERVIKTREFRDFANSEIYESFVNKERIEDTVKDMAENVKRLEERLIELGKAEEKLPSRIAAYKKLSESFDRDYLALPDISAKKAFLESAVLKHLMEEGEVPEWMSSLKRNVFSWLNEKCNDKLLARIKPNIINTWHNIAVELDIREIPLVYYPPTGRSTNKEFEANFDENGHFLPEEKNSKDIVMLNSIRELIVMSRILKGITPQKLGLAVGEKTKHKDGTFEMRFTNEPTFALDTEIIRRFKNDAIRIEVHDFVEKEVLLYMKNAESRKIKVKRDELISSLTKAFHKLSVRQVDSAVRQFVSIGMLTIDENGVLSVNSEKLPEHFWNEITIISSRIRDLFDDNFGLAAQLEEIIRDTAANATPEEWEQEMLIRDLKRER